MFGCVRIEVVQSYVVHYSGEFPGHAKHAPCMLKNKNISSKNTKFFLSSIVYYGFHKKIIMFDKNFIYFRCIFLCLL